MPMVPNAAALADGFVPVRADEVLPGDRVWVMPGLAPVVEPAVRPDGFIRLGANDYAPGCRVYVRR